MIIKVSFRFWNKKNTAFADHDRVFWVKVVLGGGREIGPVSGKSKKNAEQMVAKMALES